MRKLEGNATLDAHLPKYDHLFRQEMKKTFTQGKVKVSFCMHHISVTAFEFTCCESLVMSTGLILLKAESLSSLSLACCSTAITKASWTWLFSANSLAENTVNGIRKGSPSSMQNIIPNLLLVRLFTRKHIVRDFMHCKHRISDVVFKPLQHELCILRCVCEQWHRCDWNFPGTRRWLLESHLPLPSLLFRLENLQWYKKVC